MVSKLQLFLLYSFIYVLLDPHRKFRIREELTKINFLLFECRIMLYMLTHVFKTLIGLKANSSNDILENNGWFLLLQIELEIESLL
jgi:hypothetical protein